MSTWTAETLPNAMMILIGWVWFGCQLPFVARNIAGMVLDRRRREDRDLTDAFEAYGLVYRRPVPPPSHAAGRAA